MHAAVKDYITSRIAAVYKHDEVMKYRKSQDNPFVIKLYKDFFPHPFCEKSEHLLHSSYTDRSAGLKKIENAYDKLK